MDYSGLESNVASLFDERVFGSNNFHFQGVQVDFEEVLKWWLYWDSKKEVV